MCKYIFVICIDALFNEPDSFNMPLTTAIGLTGFD